MRVRQVVCRLLVGFVVFLRLEVGGQGDVCAQDFSVLYSGLGAVFTLGAANSTAVCPWFQGNGTFLTDLDRTSSLGAIETRLGSGDARLSPLEARLNATEVSGGPAAPPAAAYLNCLFDSDCPAGTLCSPYWQRCRVPLGGSCNLTAQCLEGQYCSAAKTCSNVYTSCADVQARMFPRPSSGAYTIMVASQATPAYCDQSTSGGGWTLVLNVNPTDGNILHHDNAAFWTSTSASGGARTNATTALWYDYKNVHLFSNFVASQVLVFVHTQGRLRYYRSWTVTTPATVSTWFNRADGANYKISGAILDSSFAYDYFYADPVVTPAAEHLYSNTQTSPVGNDFNRLSRNPETTSGDNCGWGLGTKYDTTYAAYSRPWADAIAKVCGTTWGGAWIGTDIQPGNAYGSPSGVSNSYAVYVR